MIETLGQGIIQDIVSAVSLISVELLTVLLAFFCLSILFLFIRRLRR